MFKEAEKALDANLVLLKMQTLKFLVGRKTKVLFCLEITCGMSLYLHTLIKRSDI